MCIHFKTVTISFHIHVREGLNSIEFYLKRYLNKTKYYRNEYCEIIAKNLKKGKLQESV